MQGDDPEAQLPFVSVIIPHLNTPDLLEICLRSLVDQSYPADRFEIIVADNGSTMALPDFSKFDAANVSCVSVLERGAGPARNGGVNSAVGSILAFIDADCVAEKAWLECGVRGLAEFNVVGGRVMVTYAGTYPTSVEAFEAIFAFDFERYINKLKFTGSGNMFVRTQDFHRVGGFRKAVSEDVDWSHRAIEQGLTLGYCAEAIVQHPARRTWRELTAKWRRTTLEAYELRLSRNRYPRASWLLRTWALPASAIYHTPKVLRTERLSRRRDKFGALGILYLHRIWRFLLGHSFLIKSRKNL